MILYVLTVVLVASGVAGACVYGWALWTSRAAHARTDEQPYASERGIW